MSQAVIGGFGFTEPTNYVSGPVGSLAVYERPGAGVPLVLIHGINMRAAVWAKVVDLLQDRHIVALDLRGHGRSTETGPFTAADYAADVLSVLGSLSTSPVQLAGVSFGGVIGCLIAQEAPELVQSVTAFGSALVGAHPDLEGGMKQLRKVGIDAYFRNSLRRNPPAHDPDLQQLVSFAVTDRTNVEMVIAVTRTGFDEDLTGTIRPSGKPIQIISGEFDVTCTPEAGRRLATAAGGVWHMAPGAGHVLPIEKAPECAAFLTAALHQPLPNQDRYPK